MILSSEEKEALNDEFTRLIHQKHSGKPGEKWQAKHEKHLAGVVKMIIDYERQTGDYSYFTRLGSHQAVKDVTLTAQMQLL